MFVFLLNCIFEFWVVFKNNFIFVSMFVFFFEYVGVDENSDDNYDVYVDIGYDVWVVVW